MTGREVRWALRIALPCVLLLAACNSFSKLPEGEPKEFEARTLEEGPSDYRIQPGDGLSVKFAYHPLRSLDVIVRTDGRISIPFAEEMHVAGRTIAEADALLSESVAKKLRDPELTIVVATMAKSQVFVGGEVGRPGVVPLIPGLTAYQALVAAGGFLPSADDSCVILIRADGPGKRIVRRLGFDKDGVVTHDVALGPFDILHVPRTGIADVGLFVNTHLNNVIPRFASFGAFYNVAPTTQ